MSINAVERVLIAPLISEKATRSNERENSVAFWVHYKATKLEIKKAVETFFPNVKVASVRTMIKGRGFVKFGQIEGRAKKKKKAFVKLVEGSHINFAELE